MNPVLPVLIAGLIAGSLDILYAIAFWRVKGECAGVADSPERSRGTAWQVELRRRDRNRCSRLVLHFGIAISMAFTYFTVARHWPELHQRPLLYGAAYGLLLYAVMNFVVVPLSAASPGSTDAVWIALSILVHMTLVGVPIALSVRRGLVTV